MTGGKSLLLFFNPTSDVGEFGFQLLAVLSGRGMDDDRVTFAGTVNLPDPMTESLQPPPCFSRTQIHVQIKTFGIVHRRAAPHTVTSIACC